MAAGALGGRALLTSRQGGQGGPQLALWELPHTAAQPATANRLHLATSPPDVPPYCLQCRAFAAVLFAAGGAYYVYITFLGYSALPFLERTEVGWAGAGVCVVGGWVGGC